MLEVPLRITVSLGPPAANTGEEPWSGAAASDVTEDETEALREPAHDTDYASRPGYDPNFLDPPSGSAATIAVPRLAVPMPEAADPSVLAKARDGSTILAYQNFSIAMYAKRRVALFTASNVTARESGTVRRGACR